MITMMVFRQKSSIEVSPFGETSSAILEVFLARQNSGGHAHYDVITHAHYDVITPIVLLTPLRVCNGLESRGHDRPRNGNCSTVYYETRYATRSESVGCSTKIPDVVP